MNGRAVSQKQQDVVLMSRFHTLALVRKASGRTRKMSNRALAYPQQKCPGRGSKLASAGELVKMHSPGKGVGTCSNNMHGSSSMPRSGSLLRYDTRLTSKRSGDYSQLTRPIEDWAILDPSNAGVWTNWSCYQEFLPCATFDRTCQGTVEHPGYP